MAGRTVSPDFSSLDGNISKNLFGQLKPKVNHRPHLTLLKPKSTSCVVIISCLLWHQHLRIVLEGDENHQKNMWKESFLL